MEHVFSFEKLTAWQDAKELIKYVYRATESYPKSEAFGLVSQMRRASISIASNLAEGSGRTGQQDQAHFYQMAYSSLIELLNQIIISKELDLIDQVCYTESRQRIESLSSKIASLRKARLNRKP